MMMMIISLELDKNSIKIELLIYSLYKYFSIIYIIIFYYLYNYIIIYNYLVLL